jgi:aminopeptidase N
MKKLLIGFLAGLLLQNAIAQTSPIDVQHYRFELGLSDASDTLHGVATITLQMRSVAAEIAIDLAGLNATGKGMQVLGVTEAGQPITYTHRNNRLLLQLSATANIGHTKTFQIRYKGIPADGLIIGKSIFGKRTFFGDNWPNRAHQWLPCNDVPIDKASLEFIVTAPKRYGVVSNGLKQSETMLNDSTKRTHWREEVPLPTKVMVIGAADFAVDQPGSVNDIPLYSWVYQEEKEKGFYDYAQAKEILPFFIDYIGPYPYKKLANVQSKTIFGGMENAGCIFYFERSVTGKRSIEDLMAHEIAHQWFGNMVTETDFTHLWLSEGFATYMTNLYLESKYGADSLARRLRGEREQVINFAVGSAQPIIDSSQNYMSLLNANSYQKGGWVLHLLRRQVGNAVFQQIIRRYYQQYAGKNASSTDFAQVAETVSGKPLKAFFQQWLRQPGLPILQVRWQYAAAAKKLTVTVEQKQPNTLFAFPLELGVQTAKGTVLKTLQVKGRKATASFTIKDRVIAVQPDPAVNLLWKPYVE